MRGFGSKSSASFCYPFPRDPVLLAAPPERAPPEVDDVVTERVQCATIRRHRMVVRSSRVTTCLSHCPCSGIG